MRMLMKVQMPVEPFNKHVREGTAGPLLGRIVEDLKPQATYFVEEGGKRGAYMVVEVADPSRIPALAEPFFLQFNASVEFHACMTPDDLGKANLDQLGKKWSAK